MLLSFRGYLGEIESDKKNYFEVGILYILCSTFFVNVQCFVRVSASNFQVLIRNSGGARRALGNIVRFLAGPARTYVRVQCTRYQVLERGK